MIIIIIKLTSIQKALIFTRALNALQNKISTFTITVIGIIKYTSSKLITVTVKMRQNTHRHGSRDLHKEQQTHTRKNKYNHTHTHAYAHRIQKSVFNVLLNIYFRTLYQLNVTAFTFTSTLGQDLRSFQPRTLSQDGSYFPRRKTKTKILLQAHQFIPMGHLYRVHKLVKGQGASSSVFSMSHLQPVLWIQNRTSQPPENTRVEQTTSSSTTMDYPPQQPNGPPSKKSNKSI